MTYAKVLSMCAAVAITAGGLIIMAPPAFGKAPIVVTAPAPNDIVTRHIGYADLNLASAAGERALNRRVGSAVNDLCLEATGGRDNRTGFRFDMINCTGSAWNQARPQIGRAVGRARDIASTGYSTLSAVAITIAIPE